MIAALLLAAKVAIVAVLGLAAAAGGGRVVLAVFRWVDRSRDAEVPEGEPDATPSLLGAASVLRGGQWIGILERIAIYASILSGFGEGIAIAMVLKGFARYPELKAGTTAAAERFIIGTFVSVLVGCACAGLAWWLIRLF